MMSKSKDLCKSKNEEIFQLFNKQIFKKNSIKSDDFYTVIDLKKKNYGTSFACKYKNECRVNINKQTVWTSALGTFDTPTQIMVIGEAPSYKEERGMWMGGKFTDWKLSERTNVIHFREWVRSNFKTVPYFTDAIKCGFTNKDEQKVREHRCPEYLLLKEIEIVRPHFIFCIGGMSFNCLKNIYDNNKLFIRDICKGTKVFKLMHYSNRPVLPLSIEDKKIVWKLQTGLIRSSQEPKLTDLPSFKNMMVGKNNSKNYFEI